MLGAIAGDVIGSRYEFNPVRSTAFDLFPPGAEFTDDTVMTVATAKVLLDGGGYAAAYRELGLRYPRAGYGGMFYGWLFDSGLGPYNSFGNGSAMRVGPVGHAFDSAEDTLAEARRSAEVSHNHPEGIKGAQATALAVFLARMGSTKAEIRRAVVTGFGYDLDRTTDEIRPAYRFNETCQETVPEAIICFLESTDFESAIRLAVSLGGDADTLGAITGAIAEAHYGGVPDEIRRRTLELLTPELRAVLDRFEERFLRR